MPGTATHTPFPPITFHRASPIQPPSSSALGHQTHRDRARLLLQQPEHLRRDPPPLKAAPGLGPACIPLQNDKTSRKRSQHEAGTRAAVPGEQNRVYIFTSSSVKYGGVCASWVCAPHKWETLRERRMLPEASQRH